ncbi:MAG TPA: hypothetical protein VFA20_29475 [Myxococcaceae bacterium]|nr:hypothetical protein [Myxococcaceae bacterium]
MLSQAVVTPSPSLRLAIGWYPGWFGQSPGAPIKAVVTQSAHYEGSFPLDFTFRVEGPPPAGALVDMVQGINDGSIALGTGKIAYGFLIAYEDRNGNATLDTATATTASPDRILGVSMPDLSLPPPFHTYFVVYLDGTVDKDDYFGAYTMEQGYNLFQLHSDYGIDKVPMDTAIAMQLTNTDSLGYYACEAVDFSAGNQTACGIDPFNGGYRLRGNVYGSHTTNQVWVEDGSGARTDATLTFNGQNIAFDPQGGFVLPTIPSGANTFQVSVPGHPPETINLTMPGPVNLTSTIPSTIASGTQLTLTWERDPAVELYDLYVISDANGGYEWLDHRLTTDTTLVTKPLVGSGPAHIYLQGLAPLAVGNNGSFITPLNTVRVQFTLSP